MVRIQLLHAGEEALFVLIPVGVLFFLEYRGRRRAKAEAASPASPDPDYSAPEAPPPE
jgi:hypothetical protein